MPHAARRYSTGSASVAPATESNLAANNKPPPPSSRRRSSILGDVQNLIQLNTPEIDDTTLEEAEALGETSSHPATDRKQTKANETHQPRRQTEATGVGTEPGKLGRSHELAEWNQGGHCLPGDEYAARKAPSFGECRTPWQRCAPTN